MQYDDVTAVESILPDYTNTANINIQINMNTPSYNK